MKIKLDKEWWQLIALYFAAAVLIVATYLYYKPEVKSDAQKKYETTRAMDSIINAAILAEHEPIDMPSDTPCTYLTISSDSLLTCLLVNTKAVLNCPYEVIKPIDTIKVDGKVVWTGDNTTKKSIEARKKRHLEFNKYYGLETGN